MEDVLKALAESYSKLPKREEFTAAIQAFAKVISRALENAEKRIDAKLATVRNGRDGKDGKDGKSLKGPKGDKGEKGDKGDTGVALFGPKGRDGKDGSPDTPEQVRDKLASLSPGDEDNPDERLSIDAIANLREELDDLRKRGASGQHHTFAIQRGQLMTHDLSDQLDGVKSTFTLPAFWRIISVQSTSAPVVFRPTVDYNADASVPSITFTSQVDPATTLSEGQTLLVIYAAP